MLIESLQYFFTQVVLHNFKFFFRFEPVLAFYNDLANYQHDFGPSLDRVDHYSLQSLIKAFVHIDLSERF